MLETILEESDQPSYESMSSQTPHRVSKTLLTSNTLSKELENGLLKSSSNNLNRALACKSQHFCDHDRNGEKALIFHSQSPTNLARRLLRGIKTMCKFNLVNVSGSELPVQEKTDAANVIGSDTLNFKDENEKTWVNPVNQKEDVIIKREKRNERIFEDGELWN